MEDSRETLNTITAAIIGAAMDVRRELGPLHQAQLLSYLKLSGCKVGLLINFHVKVLKEGLKRIVNEF